MKKLFSFILMILLNLSLYGQDMVFPSWRLGITPSALLNNYPGLQISLDKSINKKLNFSLESAYLFTSVNGEQGFRIRPGIEMFIARSSWVSFTSGIHYNYRYGLVYENNRTVSSNGEFFHIQYNRKSERILRGINFSGILMFKINPRLHLDLGVGYGLGNVKLIRGETIIDDGINWEPNNIDVLADGFIFPIFYTHLNFSYTIQP